MKGIIHSLIWHEFGARTHSKAKLTPKFVSKHINMTTKHSDPSPTGCWRESPKKKVSQSINQNVPPVPFLQSKSVIKISTERNR